MMGNSNRPRPWSNPEATLPSPTPRPSSPGPSMPAAGGLGLVQPGFLSQQATALSSQDCKHFYSLSLCLINAGAVWFYKM